MKHYAKIKHMVGEGSRIHNRGTLDKLNSLKNIEVGTEVEAPVMAVRGFETKLIAIEVDKDKVVWEID